MSPSDASGPADLAITTRGRNLFAHDVNLSRALAHHAPELLARHGAMLHALGAFCGGELDAQADYSDHHAPPLLTRALDQPAAPTRRVAAILLNERYKACQQRLYEHGPLAAILDPVAPAPHLLAFVTQYLASSADISTGCPFAMTHPVALALAASAAPVLREKFLPQMRRTDGQTPIGGTWATERHGGSDVARTATRAVPQPDGTVRLYGHQWFASAAGFDRWLALKTARAEGAPEGAAGLGLYLVPSHLDVDWDAHRLSHPNPMEITDLKRKMGTRGLPTAEVELDGTVAYEIAPPGEGLRAMMAALGCSRVHNAMAAAGVMARAFAEALSWAASREAFGARIITRPMVRKRLLDIMAEGMAGTALAVEAARSFDAAAADPGRQAWLRVATALAKYRTAKQATACAEMALRLGAGNHYTEDFPIERVLRDAHALAVWEGPEEVQALELMRLLLKADGAEAFLARLDGIIDHCPAEAMAFEVARLGLLRAQAAAELARVATEPEAAPELADEYLATLSLMLAYALLCEEAAFELVSYADATKLLLSDYFYARHWQGGPAVAALPHPLLAHFEAVAAGRPIAPPPG